MVMNTGKQATDKMKLNSIFTLTNYKIFMKHFLSFSILLILLSCNKDIPPKGVTRQDVLDIAAKYNLQDSLKEGYNPRFGNIPPEAFYPYLTKEQLDADFAHWRNIADSWKQTAAFCAKRRFVKNLDEYFALIESYPIFYREFVDSEGGIEAYKAWKVDVANNCNVYVDPNVGDVLIVHPPKSGEDDTEGILIHKALHRR